MRHHKKELGRAPSSSFTHLRSVNVADYLYRPETLADVVALSLVVAVPVRCSVAVSDVVAGVVSVADPAFGVPFRSVPSFISYQLFLGK
jgi:hypothetical protein